jgi:hypothetical protein
VTLGPRLTKDKLMQGAGRMRQLGTCGGGQTLWFAYLEDVAQHIRARICMHKPKFKYDDVECGGSPVRVVDVLNWVMHNTKAEVTHGLIEWAGSGIQYERSQQDVHEEAVRDDWTLENLYSTAHTAKTLAEIVTSKIAERYCEPSGEDAATLSTELASVIERQAHTFGLDDVAFVTAHTDECERELQMEEQLEEEREVQRWPCTPIRECEWSFERVVGAASVMDLQHVVPCTPIGEFFSRSVRMVETCGLQDLGWAAAGDICGTSNFFYTIVEGNRTSDSSSESARGACVEPMWQRVVDSALLFDDGSILLLSEFEADRVLEVLWDAVSVSPTQPVPVMCNLVFLLEGLKDPSKVPPLMVAHSQVKDLWRSLDATSVVACALWNGETVFTTKAMSEKDDYQTNDRVSSSLRKLLAQIGAREEAMRAFVDARGRSHRWKCSLLQKLCCAMDLEAC